MIKHIVMWRLNGKIPGLLRLEVGIDFSQEGEFSDHPTKEPQ